MLVASALKFALSPVGRAAMIFLALVAWTQYQRHDAAVAEKDRMTAIYETAKAEEIARQKAVGDAALRAAASREQAAEAKIAEYQEIANALTTELQAAGRSCPIDDDVRRRLLTIK